MKIIDIKSKLAVPNQAGLKDRPPRLGRLMIFAGLLVILLVTGWLGVKSYRIYATYRNMAPHLARLQTLTASQLIDPAALDLAQLNESMAQTTTSLETLSVELEPFLPLTAYLGWVPVYGETLEATPYLLAAGRDLSGAGVILLKRFAPLLKQESEKAQESPLPQLVTTLSQAEADLERAEALLQQAQANLAHVDTEDLAPRISGRVAQFKEHLPLVITSLDLAKGLPDLLGAESPRTYLILFQNADEIRPTGGYISAAGHVTVMQGRITEFQMSDSYDVDQLSDDYPYPPDPIYQYMGADYWVLRDAGWSPDFPSSARIAMELYTWGQGLSPDGVIAIDQHGLALILRALEPIDVAGERVTSQNVIQLMRQKWAPEAGGKLDKAWWKERKSFMLALAQAARQRFEQAPQTIRPLVLAGALQQALTEKHILLYLDEPTWSRFLAEQNWTGGLAPVQGDYLMVVDANLGFNKASAIVKRRTRYQVTLFEDGSGQARVTLRYDHPASRTAEACRQNPRYEPVYEQNMKRCYWDYMRLLVPADAELIDGPNIIVPSDYLLRGRATTGAIDIASFGVDKMSWGQLFVMAPQETLTLDYAYQLPVGTARPIGDHWHYHLFLQKQAGTLAFPAEVIVNLPKGAQVLHSEPAPASQKDGVISYQFKLKTDREINLSYSFH